MLIKKENSELIVIEHVVFNQILNGLKADVYVTDIDTNEIIFMNQTMKEDFGLKNPEGQICWKVLQKGRTERCEFCPVNNLKQSAEKNYVYQWDEINTVTQRSYRNYDCLMKWIDGRTVHLQQSIDVTQLKIANTDELTQFLTRRYGKEMLKDALQRAREEGQALTICLYDVNMLKEVNDRYGHAEGDALLLTIANAVRAALFDTEFAFRLSGDEFVIAFSCGKKEAQRRVARIQSEIQKNEQDYEISFCFGLTEYIPDKLTMVDELIFLADKRMYDQKRQFHIRRNEALLKVEVKQEEPILFAYDKERLYDALVKSTEDYIYVCNMKTGMFKYTTAMVEEFNLPSEVIENAAAIWGAKVHPDDKVAFLESNQEMADGRATTHCIEYRVINGKGEWVWVRCRGHLELDENGEPLLFAGFITNLGKKNKIDNLTGLFNKLEFKERMERLLETNQAFSIMMLGLDDLKHINDLYNRTFGDGVIRIAAQRIRSLLSEKTTIYRLDGDVFGLITHGASQAGVEEIYHTIYHDFENQQSYEGKKYYCTLSGGCLLCPEDASSYEDIVKYAYYCLEYSKSHGKKRCTYFSQDILDQRVYSLDMIELLRESVEDDFQGFYLMYQPLVRAGSNELMGVEALARWECEKYGQVSPLEFIPLLESTGLIVAVGKWILRTALIACEKWVAWNPKFIIDVNLSYIQIQDSDFFTYLRAVMKDRSFLPHNLVLEMTESYFENKNEHIKKAFQEIRDMGVRIAMDDFGTGYSTLGILKESPADLVKIDKTFIRDINTSEFDLTFIRFVVELCHNVDIEVCLEGVETQEIYEIVSSMGIDIVQGYLFDRPMLEEDFTKKYFARDIGL